MAAEKRDNSSWAMKAALRREVARGLRPDAQIFEGFCGAGKMWRAAWVGFSGVAVDEDYAKAEAAAGQRSTWRVACGDTEQLLRQGFCRSTPFDVLDLDCYGAPWPFVHAWFVSKRVRAEKTVLVLTDGYAWRLSMAAPCKVLFPGMGKAKISMSREVYLRNCVERCNEWAAGTGLRCEWITTRVGPGGKMLAHLLEVSGK